jgi:hypothetical protein
MIATIKASGRDVLIDAADLPKVQNFSWHLFKAGRKNSPRLIPSTHIGGKRVKMHRFLLDAPSGLVVDHKNHNTLDNRRDNLRICQQGQNALNQRKRTAKCTSQYKGVYFTKDKRWMAYINVNKSRTVLGYFGTELEAAQAYDRAAIQHHKEFAFLNFQPQPVQIAA